MLVTERRKSKNKIQQAGFTLVELMVATLIFSVVSTIGIGALLVILDANARVQGLNIATTNIYFAIDSMSRNIRTGYNYYCTDQTDVVLNSYPFPIPVNAKNCAGGDSAIIFRDGETSNLRGYRIRNNAIEMTDGITGDWYQITASNIIIDTAKSQFFVRNAIAGDGLQPVASIRILGTVPHKDSVAQFEIQSDVVQRTLDY